MITSPPPTSLEEVCERVRATACLLPRGSGTKPALSHLPTGVAPLDMRGMTRLLSYEPDELVLSVEAGARLTDVQERLAAHGHYLPFDPPLARAGATIGGTVAAGLSGSGRYRCGGMRDFLIGATFVDGNGRVVRGGGKVVKNAAGFDLPKLMVGSLGRLGVLVTLTFKVFPAPPAYLTLGASCGNLEEALDSLCALSRRDWGLEALDLEPPHTLHLRLAGDEAGLAARHQRLAAVLDATLEAVGDDDEAALWHRTADFAWAAEAPLVKVPLTPRQIASLDPVLARHGAQRRYAVGGNLAWIAWPDGDSLTALDQLLKEHDLAGLVLRGPGLRLGTDPAAPFLRRVKSALDPAGRFPSLEQAGGRI